MIGVDWVGMGNDLLMGVRLNTMLMPFPAMAVLSIQMRMGRRPLERNKNGKQKKNKRSVGASLDHGVMSLMLFLVLLHKQHIGFNYTQPPSPDLFQQRVTISGIVHRHAHLPRLYSCHHALAERCLRGNGGCLRCTGTHNEPGCTFRASQPRA